ncbi:M23 family metallopeptidase [Propioniciclava coleopterorum]|uniref:M23 family metallopeptidase n=1 Tax=Propioniciclava coleopterorum TaxID=2714937 RepID=A0A6G7Y8T4_9ACTN|nr:M23 family metallopeptidase [Propioniciclava coleopterorum]QIK73041.1 M23 family metallopeptidase [Propioniciclava coleopterorum]
MARSLPGSYQPRCAIEDPDAAFLDGSSLPRRKATPNRLLRGGIALGAAGVVGLLAVVTPGVATSAIAANNPAVVDATPAADTTARPGTTDAFAVRGSQTDRNTLREEIETTVETAVAERAAGLENVGEQVAQAQTAVAAEARSASLTSTTTAIDAENERIKSQVFFWPTEGGIVSPWGMRMHPILHYSRLHGGADIGGALGAPIYAVADGTVTKAAEGYNGGSGNNVRIDHGKVDGVALETSYLHMNSLEISAGATVKKGQRIGTVGNTGLSTAPHLHFSVYENGVNSDPAPWLAKGR